MITYKVEFDWLADGAYTDEAAYVKHCSVKRGREYGWDDGGRAPMRYGTTSIKMSNYSRRFDPNYDPTDVITDTFTDSGGDIPLSSHTPDTYPAGSAWARFADGDPATIDILSGTNKATLANSSTLTAYSIDAGIANITLSCTVNIANGATDTRIFARLTDASNYFYLKIDYQNSLISIIDRTADSETTLASAAATIAHSTNYTVVFTLNGSLLHGSINGYGVSVTSALHPTATKIGIGGIPEAGSTTFDTLSVAPPNLYGYLLPGKQMRITEVSTGDPVFAGWVLDIKPTGYRGYDAIIECVDGLYWLAQQKCTTVGTQTDYPVVSALYDLAVMSDWPTIASSTFPFTFDLTLSALGLENNGDVIPSWTTAKITGKTILAAMQEIAAAFGGTVYVDATGNLRYKVRYTAAPEAFIITESDVQELELRTPWSNIYNSVSVTGSNGGALTYTNTNSTSITAYGTRNMIITGNDFCQTNVQADNLADHLILITAQKRYELMARTFGSANMSFGRDLMDSILFTGDYTDLNHVFFIGGIAHEILPAGNTTTVLYLEESVYEYTDLDRFPFTFDIALGW